MSEQKHTPGPWEIDNGYIHAENRSVMRIADVNQAYVGLNWSGTDYARLDHLDANARLIAAAPDLLDAVFAFLNYDAKEPTDSVQMMLDYAEARSKAIEAYAKATGAA